MKFTTASNVLPERIDWLWEDRIPKGMISVIAGSPNQGKGLFAAHLAAHVSKQGGNVLYSAAEDSASLMTRPRLEAAGAVLANVLLTRFQLPRHMDELRETVRDHNVALIVMDPFAAHLSSGVSRHGDNIREVLNPVTDLLEETGCALVVVEHVLKRVSVKSTPLNAIGGSGSGLPAASRVAYIFGRDPSDEEVRVLAPAKFNIGKQPRCLAFETDVADLDVVGEQPFLVQGSELASFDTMRMFETYDPDKESGRPPEKRAAAAEWLTKYLLDAGGPVLSSTIQADAKDAGMSNKTLKRAAADMGIVKFPATGPKVTWDLPMQLRQMALADELDLEDEDEDGELDGDAGDLPLVDGDFSVSAFDDVVAGQFDDATGEEAPDA